MERINIITDEQEKEAILELWNKFNCWDAPPTQVGFEINEMGHIKLLRLNNRNMKEIPSSIANFSELIRLDFYYNKIHNIEIPDSLRKLRILYLGGNLITKIDGLDNFTQLNELYVHANRISKIQNINHLSSLVTLNLNGNKIIKIEGLDNLTHLRDLNLISNKITKINGLSNQLKLKRLLLDNNRITKIEGLESLTQLQEISLTNNEITKIEGIEELDNLERISLIGNPLSEIDKRVYHKGITALKKFCRQRKIDEYIKRIKEIQEILDLGKLKLDDYKILNQELEELQKKIKDFK